MTNNEIVIWIYNNIDIDRFIYKVIRTSSLEHNDKDLKQYIYLTLLEYDNDKLNKLFETQCLPQFILQIILNQRNYYKSYYNEYLKFKNTELDLNTPNPESEYNFLMDDKLIFINKELKKYVGNRKNLTKDQEYEMLAYELYRMYLKRNSGDNKLTIRSLSDRLNLNYRTVLRLMKFARENLRIKWNDMKDNDPL